MSATEPLTEFIRTAFRSIWALELLLHLADRPEESWASADLVRVMRGSALIVDQSLRSLMFAGLVATDEEGRAAYRPATAELARQVGEVQELYRRKPDMVRRIIVSSAHPGLASFADAFRLWKD